jgi:hypothetical protein
MYSSRRMASANLRRRSELRRSSIGTFISREKGISKKNWRRKEKGVRSLISFKAPSILLSSTMIRRLFPLQSRVRRSMQAVETSAIVEILPVVMFKRVLGFAIEVYAVVMIAFVLRLAVTMLMMLAVMVILALVVAAFNNQEEAIEITVEAVILHNDRADECFELKLMAGILKHKVLARSKIERKYRFSQRIKDSRFKLGCRKVRSLDRRR